MTLIGLTADGWKLVKATAKGPVSDTSVSAGASATLKLSIQPNPSVVRDVIAITSVTGLPSGIVISNISCTTTDVSITVFNPTTSAITVTANSVTAEVLAKAS